MTEEPDLVLLDLRLGDAENGWRVLDHLTLDPSTRHTPVILWSHVDDVLRAHAPALLPEHGTFVLTKPLKVEKLPGTIGEAFAGYPPIVRLNPQHRRQEFPRSAQAMPLSPRERKSPTLSSGAHEPPDCPQARTHTRHRREPHRSHPGKAELLKSCADRAMWTRTGAFSERRDDDDDLGPSARLK